MFKKIPPVAPILIISFLILSFGITRPYAGQHDWNSAFFANAARNNLRYGLLATKLGVVINAGFQSDKQFNYYTHHPLLMPLLLSLSFALFGVTEWAGRLIPILSAVLLIYFLFKLVSFLWDTKTAVLAAFLLIFSPILIYYSKIPIHETVVLGFLGLSLWFYVNWLTSKNTKFYWLVIIGLILSQLTSWAGYYFSLYLPLHAYFFAHKKITHFKLKLIGIFLIAPTMFLIYNLHIFWLQGIKAQTSLFDAFLFRFNLTENAEMFGFTYPKFIELQSRWIVIYFTRIMVALALIWLIRFAIRRTRRQPISFRESLLALMLIFGFTHNAIFRNQAFIHDYTLIYALPFFAISSAVILAKLHTKLAAKTFLATALLVFILILTATERLPYLKALFRSGDKNPGYYLGRAINQITAPEEKTLILNSQLMQFYDVFLTFYADRQLGVANILPENIHQFDYVVIPKSHDYVSDSDKQFLYSQFPHIERGGGIIFTIKDSP